LSREVWMRPGFLVVSDSPLEEFGIWNLKMRGAVTGTSNRLGYEDAGNRDIAVHRVQGAQLHNHQEQENDHWPSRVREVLQALPLPQEAPGNEVKQGIGTREQGIEKPLILERQVKSVQFRLFPILYSLVPCI